jgi:hypothetical protein
MRANVGIKRQVLTTRSAWQGLYLVQSLWCIKCPPGGVATIGCKAMSDGGDSSVDDRSP